MEMLPTTQTQTEECKMTHTVKVGDKVVYNNTDYEPIVMKGSVGVVYDLCADMDIMIDFGNSRVLYTYSHEYTPYVEPLKLEVGKTYVLNNGEKHVCERGEYHDLAMDNFWYNEDGRCGTYEADAPLSVSHEYTQPEGKTLVELDTPTLWRDMTDAEKGALLLAKHEGNVIENSCDGFKTVYTTRPVWSDDYAYRIKPTPKVVTTSFKWWVQDDITELQKSKTYEISLDMIDGKPDTASIRMEEL